MRICVVGPIPPPSGGMAVQTRQLVELLTARGNHVKLVATNAPYRPAFIGNIPGLRALFRLVPYIINLLRQIRQADVVHMMANSGWSWHLFAAPCIWIAYLLRTPVVVNYRGGHADVFFTRSWRWIAPTMSKATDIVVPSGFLKDVFAAYQINARVIPNILNSDLFKPVKGEPRSGFHLISTRNLEKIYGNDIVLAAFAKVCQTHPSSKLTVAGSGPEKDNLLAQAKQLDIADAVTFCGRLDQAEMVRLYQSADILLNASRIDNSPNSLIEAMACGVAVISTKAGGIPYLVDHQRNGILVDIDDTNAMAEAANTLMKDPSELTQLCEAALRRSEDFHQEKVLAQWQALYEEISPLREAKH